MWVTPTCLRGRTVLFQRVRSPYTLVREIVNRLEPYLVSTMCSDSHTGCQQNLSSVFYELVAAIVVVALTEKSC